MLFDRKHNPTDGGSAPALDEARVKRRRDRMAGLWAAELLGLIGKAAHDYAHELAHAHEHTAPNPLDHDEHVIRRLTRDLQGKVTAHEIREKLAHLVHEAKRQLLHEQKNKDAGE